MISMKSSQVLQNIFLGSLYSPVVAVAVVVAAERREMGSSLEMIEKSKSKKIECIRFVSSYGIAIAKGAPSIRSCFLSSMWERLSVQNDDFKDDFEGRSSISLVLAKGP
jgi:hypothetical protein